jgi:hypothetical protein
MVSVTRTGVARDDAVAALDPYLDDLTTTAAFAVSPRCSASAALASRSVRSPMSWASRHGTLGASAPRAYSSHFAGSSIAETRRLNELKLRRPDENDARTTLAAAAGRPAAPYDADKGFRLTMDKERRGDLKLLPNSHSVDVETGYLALKPLLEATLS